MSDVTKKLEIVPNQDPILIPVAQRRIRIATKIVNETEQFVTLLEVQNQVASQKRNIENIEKTLQDARVKLEELKAFEKEVMDAATKNAQ